MGKVVGELMSDPDALRLAKRRTDEAIEYLDADDDPSMASVAAYALLTLAALTLRAALEGEDERA
jgi:hypothetical protein